MTQTSSTVYLVSICLRANSYKIIIFIRVYLFNITNETHESIGIKSSKILMECEFWDTSVKGLKVKRAYVISAVDNFFDQWDPSTATPMEEVCELQEGLCWKTNFIWPHSMKIRLSDCESFSWRSYDDPEIFCDNSLFLFFFCFFFFEHFLEIILIEIISFINLFIFIIFYLFLFNY